ncbi:MAG: DUF1553 domain-containing protein [Acidobacteria bacterium]|nr:DUF1553 domain-containing protein [Acidobacteriota bacterium]
MRLLGFGLVLGVVSTLAAQAPQLPKDHPSIDATNNRSAASDLTERLRPSEGGRESAPVPRRNFIDEFIFGKMEKDGVPHASLSSDEEFFRRIHIDLTGRIPRDDELRAFLSSSDPGKRDKLVDRLAASRPYEVKWTYFFNDIYRPAPGRIGQYDNIHLDRPYNQMVYEMLTSNAISNWYVGPASYVARWVVTAVSCEDEVHEDTSDELAIHATKDFLGVDISCASCHDGARHLEKINLWLSQRKRDEIWKMAAFFGKTNVLRRTEVSTAQDEYSIDDNGPGYDPSARTVIRVDRRGKPGLLDPVYMFTGESPDSAKHPRPEFARMLTSDPQFARATVNLLWSEMFGAGIVEPVFSFDLARIDPKNPPPDPWTLQPSHPELLEALAQYFRENNYSLRSVLKLIAQSNAYQLSSQFPGEWKTSYAPYFARKFVRRLKAEEIYDSLVGATNLFTEVPIRGTDVKVRFAAEAYSPDEFIRGVNDPVLREIHFFLESFGQTNRQSSERSNEGAITQAVLLMNSPFLHRQIEAKEGSYLAGLLKEQLPDEEKIGRLFERFLVRRPTPAELAQARQVVTASPEGWEDLQWLLVNKGEFVHNF